jgi:hypothetical protein
VRVEISRQAGEEPDRRDVGEFDANVVAQIRVSTGDAATSPERQKTSRIVIQLTSVAAMQF